MTRQHFQALAEALRMTDASQETIDAIASACNRFNQNFDREKFNLACYSAFRSKETYGND